ncbi:MAG: fatty acid desaturase family protein [Halioglobus sp.]|nr:fatty acid desaturase family protein [Halioglobus sp.]
MTRDEVAYFTARSDWQAARMVLQNWLFIAAIFAVAGAWPNPLTIAAAVILLAGRQLALSVLMHDCGHRTLFHSARLNDVVGQWLCALPVMNDQPSYARGHLEHHRKAGTAEDPDLSNYQAYPVSLASFRRKAFRDLTGQTGFKLMSYIFRGASGVISNEKRESALPFVQQLLVQLVLFLVLAAFGIAWTFILWVVAYMTVFMFIIRVRQIAEHAAVPNLFDPDSRLNTRTVDAPWWQRVIFAPCGVNFHMEHHFMASVPCYKLKELREHLRRRHALDGVPEFHGYGQVLRHVVIA